MGSSTPLILDVDIKTLPFFLGGGGVEVQVILQLNSEEKLKGWMSSSAYAIEKQNNNALYNF